MPSDAAYNRAYYERHRARILAMKEAQRRGAGIVPKEPIPIAARFWARVDRTDTCWLWRGALDRHGYGRVGVGGTRTALAHRVAYMLAVGPIPDGFVLDHLCRIRACVNPAHLEPVTQVVNLERARAAS